MILVIIRTHCAAFLFELYMPGIIYFCCGLQQTILASAAVINKLSLPPTEGVTCPRGSVYHLWGHRVMRGILTVICLFSESSWKPSKILANESKCYSSTQSLIGCAPAPPWIVNRPWQCRWSKVVNRKEKLTLNYPGTDDSHKIVNVCVWNNMVTSSAKSLSFHWGLYLLMILPLMRGSVILPVSCVNDDITISLHLTHDHFYAWHAAKSFPLMQGSINWACLR